MLSFEQSSTTVQRRQGRDLEFEGWVRRNRALQSSNKISRTDLDVMWSRWQKWMLIEKKHPGERFEQWQRIMFQTLDKAARSDVNYFGFHLLVIEKRFPLGQIVLDHNSITLDQLEQFLRWEAPEEWYKSVPLAS